MLRLTYFQAMADIDRSGLSKKKSKKRILCDHCHDYIPKRTFYEHRRLYFDSRTQQWSDHRVFNPLPDADDMFDIRQPMDFEGIDSSLHYNLEQSLFVSIYCIFHK